MAAISRSCGLLNRLHDQKNIVFAHSAGIQKQEPPSWSVVVSHLDHLLASMQIKAKSKLQVTLASHFIRYVTLPPLLIKMNTAEKLAYATATYRETYGAIADDWEIKLRDTHAGQATLVAAVDKKLLDALKQIAQKYQLKMTSVQPYVMTVFNRLSKAIGHTSGYLVIVECNRLLLIDLENGHCEQVRTFTLGSDWQVELSSILMRERLLSEHRHRRVLVYAPKQKQTVINEIKEWQLQRINLSKQKLADYQFAMLEVLL